jgi:hypothetical protein
MADTVQPLEVIPGNSAERRLPGVRGGSACQSVSARGGVVRTSETPKLA